MQSRFALRRLRCSRILLVSITESLHACCSCLVGFVTTSAIAACRCFPSGSGIFSCIPPLQVKRYQSAPFVSELRKWCVFRCAVLFALPVQGVWRPSEGIRLPRCLYLLCKINAELVVVGRCWIQAYLAAFSECVVSAILVAFLLLPLLPYCSCSMQNRQDRADIRTYCNAQTAQVSKNIKDSEAHNLPCTNIFLLSQLKNCYSRCADTIFFQLSLVSTATPVVPSERKQ